MQYKKILVVVLVIAITLGIGVIGWMLLVPNSQEPQQPVTSELPTDVGLDKPEVNTEFDGVKIDLVDYKTYESSNLDFKFVIAQIRVKANDSTNIGLEHFKTSEGITLDNYQEYVNKLEQSSFYLGKQNVWFELVSNEKEYFVNIFIPVKDVNATSIDVTIDFDNNKPLHFDLTKKKVDVTTLKYQANDIISDGKTYQLKVSSAWDITGEQLFNGENEFLIPSTMGVYCFNLDVVSLWKDKVVVEKAYYYPENSKDVFEALGSNITSMKHSNIIGKEITEKDSGSLFFTVFNPMDNPITYKGVLKLQISGSDNMIEIDVDLN